MELAEVSTGRWLVETVTAVYVLDLDAGTLRRSRRPSGADGFDVADLRGDGAELPLIRVLCCSLGWPMAALVSLRVGVVTLRLTTPVQRISAATDQAALHSKDVRGPQE